jgi:hypothetical protein
MLYAHTSFEVGAILSPQHLRAAVEALNASLDPLLVAFDGAQFYRIFACASDAFNQGRLDPAPSESRLKRSSRRGRWDLSREPVCSTASKAAQAAAVTGEIAVGTSETAAAVRPISQCRQIPQDSSRVLNN